jgi:ribosomal protein S12 methylthiotransferase
VGFFSYSREEGTPAFGLSDQVPGRVKKPRLTRARDAQRAISNSNDAARVGERIDVLIESKRLLPASSPVRSGLGTRLVSIGRSVREAPGVDGCVYVAGDHELGTFVPTDVVGYTDFDRYGTPAA